MKQPALAIKTKAPTVGVIDLGSNSIKLLVASLDKSGHIRPIFYKSEDTRIAQASGVMSLSVEAIDAAVHSVHKLYTAMLNQFQPQAIQIVGTSAVRDAANKDLLCLKIKDLTGLPLRVLSGEEEALAIAQGVQLDPQLQSMPAFTVFDLGGGSLELMHLEQGSVCQALSLPLGAVRLMEDCVAHPDQALSSEEADAIAFRVKESVKNSNFNFLPLSHSKSESIPPLIGTGGAMTILKNTLGDHPPFFKDLSLYDLFIKVASADLSTRIHTYQIPPKRADIFPTALAIILTILQLSQNDRVYHSYYSLRFGIAYQLLQSLG